ncbi:MAG: Ig-like domain-containing protein, partial [Bifidobacteriaceae bacterium]|nr:Ig-like domain-containing protein [Bifidobacteriaceae bacterium]
FTWAGATNTLRPYCASPDASYLARTTSGPCHGARLDGVDALDGAGDPLAAAGGAAIVSRVDMSTDLAVVTADFGVSIAGSWGDAPLAQTTNAQGGPQANPRRAGEDYLMLGAQAGLHPDGQNHAEANAHPGDDGLEFAPVRAGQTDADRDWTPAQSKLLVAGKKYRFRAQATGQADAVAGATIRAWITSVSGGVAATTFSTPLLGGAGGDCAATPDSDGRVYCDHTASTSLPSSGMVPVYARARVSTDPGVTATSRAPNNPATEPWVGPGEVEDYQMGVAGAVVRLQARTLGNIPAHVRLALSNVVDAAPSRLTDVVAANAASTFAPSQADHAVLDRSVPVVITTTGVGQADATELDGWELGSRQEGGQAIDTYCFDSASGARIATQIVKTTQDGQAVGSKLELTASSDKTLPEDVTCRLTYAPQVDLTISTVTAEPSANQADPIIRPAASTVTLDVLGQVRGADGELVDQPVEGASVSLELAPRAGSGATPAGARFEHSDDGGHTWQAGGQAHECQIGPEGDCVGEVRVVASVAGTYELTAKIDGAPVNNLATGQASNVSPVVIAFKDARADQDASSMTITDRAGQPANHDATDVDPADWGKQTITVALKDSGGKAYQDGVAELRATQPLAGGAEGVHYGQASGGQGVFRCAEPEQAGRCAAGLYALDVHASKAGAKRIEVTYTPADGGAPFKLVDAASAADPKDRFVTANFTAPPVSAKDSVIIFTGPGESEPQDTGEADDDPDGVGIAQLTGHPFELTIRVWDSGRNNPLGGREVEFRVDPQCVGSFAGGAKTEARLTSADGRASTTLTSNEAGACAVHGFVKLDDGSWAETAGGDGANGWRKTAQWTDSEVDLTASGFAVEDKDVVADGEDTGVITVTLTGKNGLPVTTAASALTAAGPAGAELRVDHPFTHLGAGRYQASFHGTKAGRHQVAVTHAGQTVNGQTGANTLARLVPGPVHPGNTAASLSVADDTALANGQAFVEAWMTVQDANHNPIAGATGCAFELPANPGTDVVWFGSAANRANPLEAADAPASGADGRCVAQIRSYTKGQYPVKGVFGDEASPGPDTARPKAKFDNVTPDAAHSWWTVAESAGNAASPPRADGQDSHTVTVNLRSTQDQPAPLQPVVIHWQLQPGGAEVSQTVSTDTSGTAVFQLKATVKGVYRLRATTAADDIPTAPGGADHTRLVDFQSGPTASAKLTTSENVQLPLDDLAHSHFAEVVLKDAHGNFVAGDTVHFTLDQTKSAHFIDPVTGADLGKGPLERTTSALGAALARIASPATETTTLNAYRGAAGAGGANVGTAKLEFADYDPPSPAHSTFAITPDPATSELTADGVEAYTGTVTLKTANGVPVAGHHVTFEHPAALDVAGDGVTDAAGRAEVKFTSAQAGAHTVNAKIDAATIPPADQRLRFKPGAVSPAHSTLFATSGKALANGAARHSVWVVARDANSNPVAGQDVGFTIEPGSAAPGPTLTAETATTCDFDAADKPAWCSQTGMALVQVTSLEPGSFNVRGYLGSAPDAAQEVDQSPRQVQFAAGSPDPAKSSRTVTPDTDADATASVAAGDQTGYRVVATVKSAADLLVDGAVVRLRLVGGAAGLTVADPLAGVSLADGQERTTGSPHDGDRWGQFAWRVTSTRAGSYSAVVEVRLDDGVTWEQVGAPVALRFRGGQVGAAQSWLVQPDGTAPADGATPQVVKVHAKDALGNDAAAGAVVFSYPAGVSVGGVAGPGAATATVAGGWASIEVVSKRAGVAHEVTAKVEGGEAVKTVKQADESAELRDDGTVRLTYRPLAGDPDKSVLTVPTAAGGATVLADNVAKHRAEVEVRDQNGNLATSGAAAIVFTWKHTGLDGVGRQGESAPVATDANGVAAWSFGSLVATTWEISARVAGVSGEVAGSPQRAGFHAGPVDEAQTLASFEVDSTAKTPDGLSPAWARLTALDANQNPVKSVALGFRLVYSEAQGPLFEDALTGSKTAPAAGEPELKSGPDGRVQVNIYSVFSGAFEVRGVIGQSLSEAKTVNFSDVTPDPDQSDFQVREAASNQDSPPRADGKDEHTVEVTLRDAAGVLANNGSATVYFTPLGIVGAAAQSFPVTTGKPGLPVGVDRVSLKTLKAGRWQVEVKIGDKPVALKGSSPAVYQVTIEFGAGPAVAAKSRLVSPTAPAEADGDQQQVILAEVRDQEGNPASGTVVFTVPSDLTAVTGTRVGQEVSVETGASGADKGVAKLALTSLKTGSFEVTAKLGATAIDEGGPARAVFVNTALAAERSVFDIPSGPGAKTVVTESHTPRLQLFDKSGNPYVKEAVQVSFEHRLSGTSQWEPGATLLSDPATGVALWTGFTVERAGLHQVRAWVGTVRAPDAATTRDALFKAGPASAQHSLFEVSAGPVKPDGQAEHWARVTVRDAHGNPVAGQAVSFTLPPDAASFTNSGCDQLKCVLTSSALGVAEARVKVPQDVTLTTHVVGSLGDATAEPDGLTKVGEADLVFAAGGPDPAESSWTVSPAHPAQVVADGTAAFEGVVTLRDDAGVLVVGGQVAFEVPNEVKIVEAPPYRSGPDGLVKVHFTALTAGEYLVNAQVAGVNLKTVDQRLAFKAGPADPGAAHTYLTGPTSPGTADGQDRLTVLAT